VTHHTQEEFSEYATSLAEIPDRDRSYSIDRARGARQFAENIGQAVFEGLNLEYKAIGALGEKEERLLGIARERDCDHVFISGRKRSPGSVQIRRFHAKANDLGHSSAVAAVVLLKQSENEEFRRFTSRKIRSTLFRFPCFSYLKSRPCRRQASRSGIAPSTRDTALATSCFSRSSAKSA
jgi:hypothetical protein